LFALERSDAFDPRAAADASVSDFLGVRTNNVAEYEAVVRGLALAVDLGARHVDLLLDSKLIVEQLHGRWRLRDANLAPLWAQARRMLDALPDGWTAMHVPRAQNTIADALANEAIDRVAAGGAPSVIRRSEGRFAGSG
jgi:ribonuclease H / adenosylcobalamin/alpha-ribazole phosphatase